MNSEALTPRIASTASRVLLVFITYALLLVATAGLVSSTGLVAAPAAPLPGPEPIRGVPVVALASAGLVSWFILRSSWVGTRLAVALAAAFFGAHTLLPELDALTAPGSFSRAGGGAAGAWFGGAVFAATLSVAAVVILRHTGRAQLDPRAELTRAPKVLAGSVKLMTAAVLQMVVHAGVGCRLGWYSAPDRVAFTGLLDLLCPAAPTGASVGPVASSAELVRGGVWALVGLLLVRLLRRGPAETALAVGLFFALAAPVHQLLPGALSPGDWAFGRQLALATSQLACGAALALWFSWQGPAFLEPRGAGRGSSPSLERASRDGRGAGGLAG